MFTIFMMVGVVLAQNDNGQISTGVQTLPSNISAYQRDINQWNIIQHIGNQPTALPGSVWIQVPFINVLNQNAGQTEGSNSLQQQEPSEDTDQAEGSNNIQQHKVGGENVVQSVGQGIPPAFVTNEVESAAVVPSGAGLNGRCLLPRGQFPGTSCNKYVNCWEGTATEQECPEGLFFSSVRGYCDFADRVDCTGRPVVPGSPPPVSSFGDVTVSWTSATPPSAGQSSSGAVSQETAPTAPAQVSFPIAATLPSADIELNKYCLQPRGQFPSAACNKYVNCWDGSATEQECPEGLVFSTKGYCDYVSNVNCGERSFSLGNEIADVKECPLESGTFRDKNNCASYYTCLGYKIVAKYECPAGLKYSDYIGVCDFEDRVDCTKEPLIYQRKIEVKSVPKYEGINTECPVEYGTYRNEADCASYYTCISYKIVAKHNCPSGFLYNQELGICDYSERVDCTKTFQRKSNFIPQLPTGYMDKVKSCTPGNVLRLNPECSAVCFCRDGVAEIIQCPAGTAYDSTSDKCVLPHLARC